MLHLIIQAALVCDSEQTQGEIAFWKARRLDQGFPMLLDEQPRVVKYYGNSHGADRGHRSELHDSAAKVDLEEVTRLLNAGYSYDLTMTTKYYQTITPLFAAEFYDHQAVADELLRREKCSQNNMTKIRLFTPKHEPSKTEQSPSSCPCVIL